MFRLDGLAASQTGWRVACLLGLALLLGPRASTAGERYLVVEAPPFGVRAAEQERLTSAIQSGLRAAGCDVASEAVRSEPCSTAACWRKLAAQAMATDLLVVTGGYQGMGWQMSFEHRNGASGAKLGSERESCETCPFDDMEAKASVTAKHMAEVARAEAAAALTLVPSPPAELVPKKTETNPLLTPPEAGVAPVRPLWPIILMAGGGAMLAGGIALVAIDGRDTDCSQDTCLRRYKTMGPGLILGGVGIAAAAVGFWQYVAWQPEGKRVSLRVGPGNFSLNGGF